MTPAEHIAEAERLIAVEYEDNVPLPLLPSPSKVWLAIAHTLIALTVEAGTPHATTTQVGGTGGS